MNSICKKCGLLEEICVCESIAIGQQTVELSTVKRKYGKIVTIIKGISNTSVNLENLSKKLKNKCATGGTIKSGCIELQGNHKNKIQTLLNELGFNVIESKK